MSLFQRGKQAELKDGWVNGHRVRTAHIRGTSVYTVKIDDQDEVTLYSESAFARHLYRMTHQRAITGTEIARR